MILCPGYCRGSYSNFSSSTPYYSIIGGLQKACCKSPSVGELIASVWDVEAVVVDLGEMRDVIKVDKHFKSLLASVI